MGLFDFFRRPSPATAGMKPVPAPTAPSPIKGRTRVGRSVTAAALATTVIGGAEGLRQNAYPDPATRGKPWTICYGHTGPDVHPGQHASMAECKALLIKDLDKHAVPVERCLGPMTERWSDERYVAVLSLAYNIGSGGFCKSSIVRLFKEGRDAEACHAFLKYNRAAGMVMPGLTSRRKKEEALCLVR